MKIFKTLLFFSLVINCAICYSQDVTMNKEVEEMIALGKDSIVQIALNLIDKKVNKEDYIEVKMLTNGEEIVVYFSNPIEFVTEEDLFYFGARVSLLSKKVHYNTLYYRKSFAAFNHSQTEEAKESVLFVLKELKDPRYSGSINTVSFEDTIDITEWDWYYSITIRSKVMQVDFDMHKEGGPFSLKSHMSIEPDPDTESLFIDGIHEFKEIE